jgi:hypothetical protein
MATANMEISTSEAATAGHIVEGSKRARRQLERYNGLQHNNDGAFISDLLRLGSATSEFFGYDDEDGASSYAGNEHVSSDDDTRMEDELPGAEEDDDDDDDDEYLQSIKDRETNGRHHVRRGRHADHDGQACERQVVQHRTPPKTRENSGWVCYCCTKLLSVKEISITRSSELHACQPEMAERDSGKTP